MHNIRRGFIILSFFIKAIYIVAVSGLLCYTMRDGKKAIEVSYHRV